ncbi:uroporphyrinogen decarboxylase, partial [mine drainage metagenome]
PKIHFALNSASIVEDIMDTGCDVISIGWYNNINHVWSQIGFSKAIQGNLDPALLAEGGRKMIDSTVEILESAGGRQGYIFNLGHGVLPETRPENVRKLVDIVHSFHYH